MKVIIVGGVAAGMSAASKLKRMKKDTEVVVYEKRSYVSFGACGLPYYIGGFFEEPERMLVRTPKQFAETGIDVKVEHEVLKIDVENKKVVIKDHSTGEEYEDNYDKLLLASGAGANKPSIPGITLSNVKVLHSMEDGLEVRDILNDPTVQRVGIIGAGFIGLEAADAVRHLGKKVLLFQSGDRILNGPFDLEITKILEQELQETGVELYTNTKVEALTGTKKVKQVVTNQGIVDVDFVLIATGVQPNTNFLKDTGIAMHKNGAILIDEECQTSIPDIYAAGDCATIPHRLKDTPSYLPLATTANKLGRMVGENLAGKHNKFEGTLGSACIKVMGMEAGRTGLSETEVKELGIAYRTIWITDKNHTDYYPGQEKISIKLIYDAVTKVILGGQIVGKTDAVLRTNVIATAITAGMTTSQLGMLDLCYAPPFSRTWDVLNVAGNAAK